MSANNDLQASHQIIQWLELAKAQSELVLDSLPGLFAIVDQEGVVHRGNILLANLLEVPFQDITGCRFDQKIGEKAWATILLMMKKSQLVPESGMDFETFIGDAKVKKISFIWNLRPFRTHTEKGASGELYVLMGRDVSEIKAATENITRMKSELTTAKTVQETLFPPTEWITDWFSIAGFYEPASECGGDWWFYNQIEGQVYLWIGDVTGHGVGAAMVASAARSAVSVIETIPNMSPALALEILNRAIYSASKSLKLMSFFVGAINLETGVCTYAVAGHEAPVLISKNGETSTVQFLASKPSCLLGQEKIPEFLQHQINLNPGDRLFLSTDGVAELRNLNRLSLGPRRALKLVLKCSSEAKTPSQFISLFGQEIEDFRNGYELQDDLTFLVFEMGNLALQRTPDVNPVSCESKSDEQAL